jgi:melibiose permease/lactose/raffinose/galactose permease
MDQKTVKKNRLMFPLGTVGRDMMYQLFTNYLYAYVLLTRQLDKAQLATIAAIMVAARVFDALNDPLMGNIIDRTRTKWGKFKPWLVIGILTTSLVIYAAFNTKLQGWPFVIFFGVIYFLYSVTYTMHDISYWGMIPSLSTDAAERNLLTSRTNLFAGFGGALANFLIPMLTVGAMTIGRSSVTAYGVIALIIAVITPLFLCFTIFGVRENRAYEKEPAPKISIKKIIRTIVGNDQLRWIIPIFLLQQIGNGVVLGGLGQFYIYFQFGYAGGLYSLFNTIGMLATAVLMILYPVISAKVQRKALMKKLLLASIIGYAVMLAAGLFGSSLGMIAFWIITLGFMIANVGQYGFYLILMISILNTVEYNEYTTGSRDDAIIASIRPFVTKLGGALIVVITTVTYLLFNVTDTTNQISDYEMKAQKAQQVVVEGMVLEQSGDEKLATVLKEIKEQELGVFMTDISEDDLKAVVVKNDEDKLNEVLDKVDKAKLINIDDVLSKVESGQTVGLLLTMVILSFVFMLLTYVLYMKHYKLDEPEYERICKELEERKAAPQA